MNANIKAKIDIETVTINFYGKRYINDVVIHCNLYPFKKNTGASTKVAINAKLDNKCLKQINTVFEEMAVKVLEDDE